MVFPTPPKITTAIPNKPFYSYQSWQVCGSYLSYTVGCGICVNPDGTITTWDDGCGIFAVVGGPGICAVNTDGVVEVSNTGVIALNAACGLYSTGGQEPTVGLIDSGVVPGSYAYPSITVDQKGRVTAAISRPATIRCDVITAKGDLIVGQASQTGTALPVGTVENSFLMVNSACPLGMQWAAPADTPYVLKCCLPTQGTMVVGSSTPNTPITLLPGTSGQLLRVNNATSTGLSWTPDTGRIADPCTHSTISGSVPGLNDCRFVIGTAINPSRCNYYFVNTYGSVWSCSNLCTFGLISISSSAGPSPSCVGYTTAAVSQRCFAFSVGRIISAPTDSNLNICLNIVNQCVDAANITCFQASTISFGF